ncbi:LysR family transcriptional regulator [Alcaligenes sp. 13f]|uniref:LysR family transcriptional regulator n=1 Tax=Alcaligenes sp. 13f TaxID=2841924 RepID=UPI001CF61DDE|nr:LysR family transcriptional regulator [Alcaligenes sp. 13f]
MNLNFRDLKYFQIVAELGNVGLAADKLGRTKPALSKAIHRLEDAFECELFERKGRGIQLTAVGEVLLARARLLRGATEEVLREVNDFSRGQAGHVRIGSGPSPLIMSCPKSAICSWPRPRARLSGLPLDRALCSESVSRKARWIG